MTSNVGAQELKRNKYVGFTLDDEGQDFKAMKSKVMDELKKAFRPEFLNRIDETIVFHSLEKKHLNEIVTLMIDQLQSRLKEQDLDFNVSQKAIEKISKEGIDLEYGARPLRRSIQKNIEDLLSEELLKGTIQKGQKVNIDVSDQGEMIVV
jgi:ATP-dependent Clp protease ATP-binding subunit ClpC